MLVAKTLQVRDLPDEVHAELVRRARIAGTSLSDYVADLLTTTAAKPTISEWLKRAERQPKTGVTGEQVVAAIREGRSG